MTQAKLTPINVVESGPVAGVFGASILGKLIGEPNVIAFDVGGTTAKCSLIDEGEVKVTTSYYIEKDERNAGYPIMAPVVDIVEIGNGGGSIAWMDEAGSLKVGPKSAGALPGPVAYGKGGTEPTTTDANLIAGRLSAKNFDMEVDLDAVRAALREKVGAPLGIGRGGRGGEHHSRRGLEHEQRPETHLRAPRLRPARFHDGGLRRRRADARPHARQGAEHPQGGSARGGLRVLRLGHAA